MTETRTKRRTRLIKIWGRNAAGKGTSNTRDQLGTKRGLAMPAMSEENEIREAGGDFEGSLRHVNFTLTHRDSRQII